MHRFAGFCPRPFRWKFGTAFALFGVVSSFSLLEVKVVAQSASATPPSTVAPDGADRALPGDSTNSGGNSEATPSQDDYELMRLFVDTLDEVERNYVEPISRRELMEAAIEGLISKLDDYSDYIPPNQLAEFRREIDSEFGGIGIQVQNREGQLEIVTPLAASPGLKAGLRPGDIVLRVDDVDVADWPVEEAVKQMKGRVGTQVTLTVQRASGDTETVTIQRDTIQVETVFSYRRNPNGDWDYWIDPRQRIGYLRIRAFGAHTTEEVRGCLETMTQEGLRALILDLRSNPGGLLSSAIEVSDLFLKEGTIVSTRGRNIEPRVWSASSEVAFTDFPVAALVNRMSASASEIVAACLQDHQRAIVVGERTWGKGSVQRVVELEEGKSALKLTTASFIRPNGHNIHRFPHFSEIDEWGVRPSDGYDVHVTQQEEERIAKTQVQGVSPFPGPNAAPFYFDPQLTRALQYLREQL